MTSKHQFANILAALLLFSASLAGAKNAMAYTPFTPVQSVCPTCQSTELPDTIVLKNDTILHGKVVGENNDYIVIYRYGEYRAIKNDEVLNVKWGNGIKPAELGQRMQVTLKNGAVLSGIKKSESENPAYLILELPELKRNIIIFKSTITKEYPAQTAS